MSAGAKVERTAQGIFLAMLRRFAAGEAFIKVLISRKTTDTMIQEGHDQLCLLETRKEEANRQAITWILGT